MGSRCSACWRLAGEPLIGCVVVTAGKVVEGWFPLLTRRKTRKGEVRMRLHLTAVEHLPMYCQGVGPGGCYGAVHKTYFPLRRGCRITLYQNASVTTDEEVRSLVTCGADRKCHLGILQHQAKTVPCWESSDTHTWTGHLVWYQRGT